MLQVQTTDHSDQINVTKLYMTLTRNTKGGVDSKEGLVQNWERSKSRLYVVTLLKLYAEYIMGNAGLDEAQAGIKIAEKNINNLRYADDTTVMAESKEELKTLLMKVKEESEKADLKLK